MSASKTRRLLFLMAGLLTTFVSAQPVPRIKSLTPEWIQRGTTVTVTVSGENLSAVNHLVFSGDGGLSATIVPPQKPAVVLESSQGGIRTGVMADDKTLRVELAAAADASLNRREVRAVSPAGASEPLGLNVGDLPEITASGGNTAPDRAQKIVLPAAIEGRVGAAGQTNYFRFAARKGQTLILDVWAFRVGSPLDSSLALLDSAGKELVRNEDYHGFDSFIEFTVPADGDYLVQLRDFQFRGGTDYTYRLIAGALPYVDSVFPLGGQRGHTVEVELKGRNLDGVTRLPLQISADSPLGLQDLRVSFARGFCNPFRFAVSDQPEILETEPNNATNDANAVTPPVTINGRMNADRDVDTFKLKLAQDAHLICEVEASSLGSPLDSLLTLTDAKGTVLAQNDDANGPDARIETDFKKDTEYFLSLRDLLNRGGDSYAYRLSIHPPAQDFAVRFEPDTPRLSRGGHVPLRCEWAPRAGFSGTVRLTAQGLPPGVFSEPLLLSPTAPSGFLMLSAAGDAPLGTFPLRLSAEAVMNSRPVTRRAVALADNRPALEGFLTVLPQAPFTIDPITLSAAVEQLQTTRLEAEIHRWGGFAGEVKVSAEGYSNGREPITRSFDFQPVTLKNPGTDAVLDLRARPDAETGTRNLLLRGEARVNGQEVVEYSRLLPVTIRQLPYTIASNLKRLSIAVLPAGVKSAAGEAVFTIKADRRGYSGPIALSLDGLPDTVTAVIDDIATNAAEAPVKLTAKTKAPVGKEISFRVIGAATVNDRNYRERTETIQLSLTAPPEDTEEKTAAK
ncbi:MAG: pre-peptidase C-terminal domain-containing protein [Verrucomicrobia bacterium]|nr:pre-peptidase C-terminal domain-containing protein [Verrucomicrobiota bacterium]